MEEVETPQADESWSLLTETHQHQHWPGGGAKLRKDLDVSGSRKLVPKTGFQFMANRQFRMEQRSGTSVCADISQYALQNQYIKFLYEKISQHFCG